MLGAVDLPHEQRRSVGAWRPASEGALLAVGDRGSGRSTLLASLAAQSTGSRLVAGAGAEGPEALWDAVAERSAGLLLLDDLDLAVGRMPDEYAADVLDRLALALRTAGGGIAATARAPLAGALRPLGSAFGDVLVLRTGREHHAALLGAQCAYDGRVPPGGGWWRGDRIQLASADGGGVRTEPASVVAVELRTPLLVVSRTPERRLAQVRRAGGARAAGSDLAVDRVAVVGVDDFTATPSLWSAAARTPLLLDGCTPAEHRAITRRRELPPLLAPLEGRAWLVRPEEPTVRASVAWAP
ncbi:hypothetical protein [Naasia aerilata]|uniref:AAA+ ATPase domain-containing protein n=1 Tax=Naasia aerilata TaxID=1162966 RepID=A0ABN6XKQ1_9MICO|nr:hypothetical protein [Naasia aerilata]BDZ44176.1 hypothetical protein GCM10025866_00850 [Naasia aerilata]